MKIRFAASTFTLTMALGAAHVDAADLVDTAITSGNLKSFVAAVRASGFLNTLKNTGPYTVFAPSDEAFAKLPAGTMDALLKDKTRLARMIAHQIIPGKLLVADVKPGKIKTLEGDHLRVTSDNGLVTVDDATVIQSDISADNGVIQEIDTVMLEK